MKLDEKVFYGKKGAKPVAILTNSLVYNFQTTNPGYENTKLRKIILTKKNDLDRFIEYNEKVKNKSSDKIKEEYKSRWNIEFKGFDEINYKKAIQYLKEEEKFEFISSEVGVSTIKDELTYEDNKSIDVDTLFLSFYNGKVELML